MQWICTCTYKEKWQLFIASSPSFFPASFRTVLSDWSCSWCECTTSQHCHKNRGLHTWAGIWWTPQKLPRTGVDSNRRLKQSRLKYWFWDPPLVQNIYLSIYCMKLHFRTTHFLVSILGLFFSTLYLIDSIINDQQFIKLFWNLKGQNQENYQ